MRSDYLPARSISTPVTEPLLAGVTVNHASRIVYSAVTKKVKTSTVKAGRSLSGFNLAGCKILSSYNIFKFFIKHILKPNDPTSEIQSVNSRGFLTLQMQGRGTGCWRGLPREALGNSKAPAMWGMRAVEGARGTQQQRSDTPKQPLATPLWP